MKCNSIAHKYLQLESHTLQCLGSALHDQLSSMCRPSKANLVNAGMAGNPGSKVVVSAERLHDTRGEELLRKFNELQSTVWGEWAATYQELELNGGR